MHVRVCTDVERVGRHAGACAGAQLAGARVSGGARGQATVLAAGRAGAWERAATDALFTREHDLHPK
ncbi:hypothetical protein CDL15_Pgr026270 [Punica granatum]|uniref:Uncharacterized protein n=1 Tax=Punica granatum TaxID=22663 RepID=A0A218XVN4_PUNGR|nr:hypothetical protein CDL15_Pgr026270 [Punica granatum]PKI65475.1 hypothetical protein CRG98_014133 [Punica granatum]